MKSIPDHEVVVIGAGFAGLYMLHRLKTAGIDAVGFERGAEVGGVWFWNRYPGARCDLESLQYSFSFDDDLRQDWTWTERFSPQEEIQRYLSHVADRFDLRSRISFSTAVVEAKWSSATNSWTVRTDSGRTVTAHHVIMATGALSTGGLPPIADIDRFEGNIVRTATWPAAGIDLAGKKVGVIGTGSSGVQVIPLVSEIAQELVVFQRTPAFCLPAKNATMDAGRQTYFKDNHRALRQEARKTRVGMLYDYGTRSALEVTQKELEDELERRWQIGGTNFMYAFNDSSIDERANARVADFVRGKIRDAVDDPHIADMLTPRNFPLGAKRVTLGTNYYETFNRSNVTLVDITADPIARLTARGVRTQTQQHDLDIIIFATGFDALSGALLAMEISADGKSLRDHWAQGPRSYLGLTIAGFPNMFVITGPGAPSVLDNMVLSIEQDVDWIAECLLFLRERGASRIEASTEAEAKWCDHVQSLAKNSLFTKADSWYTGANIPGKPRQVMPYLGGIARYIEECREVAEGGYLGFVVDEKYIELAE